MICRVHGTKRFNLALLTAIAILFCALTKPASAQCGTTPATGAITWTTNWCDEFNGAANSPISSTNWTYDTGGGGFGNNELETYCAPTSNTSPCSSSSPNAYIDGSGHLAIQVRLVGSTYTSARLKTQGLQSFHSGRIEASIQMPSHAGLWPAFWNLGSQAGVSWPTVGESDVMENWPTTSNIPGPGATGNRSTIHTKLTGGSGIGGAFTFPSGEQVNTAFHTYGEIWSANMIQYYVDDPTHPFFVVTAADLPAGDADRLCEAISTVVDPSAAADAGRKHHCEGRRNQREYHLSPGDGHDGNWTGSVFVQYDRAESQLRSDFRRFGQRAHRGFQQHKLGQRDRYGNHYGEHPRRKERGNDSGNLHRDGERFHREQFGRD